MANDECTVAHPSLKDTLAQNILKLIELHQRRTRKTSSSKGPSVAAWAKVHQTDDKIPQRIQSARSITLVSLERIAKSENLEPWQLLFPTLDPTSPPVLTTELSERAVALARAFDGIRDAELRQHCFSLAMRRIAIETENS